MSSLLGSAAAEEALPGVAQPSAPGPPATPQCARLLGVHVCLLLQVRNQRRRRLRGGVDAELVLQHQLLLELQVVGRERVDGRPARSSGAQRRAPHCRPLHCRAARRCGRPCLSVGLVPFRAGRAAGPGPPARAGAAPTHRCLRSSCALSAGLEGILLLPVVPRLRAGAAARSRRRASGRWGAGSLLCLFLASE